jgi:hypothetical protein
MVLPFFECMRCCVHCSMKASYHGGIMKRKQERGTMELKQEKHDTMTDKRWCVYAITCLLISVGIISLTFVV